MNDFKDFDIKIDIKSFTGDKIKVERVLNRKVTVHAFRIEDSKYPKAGNDKCLYMQISIAETKHVIFTSSIYLRDMILKVPEEKFPFSTTIVKENDRYEFS